MGPFGTEITGFKVTVSRALDPESVVRTTADIEQILESSKVDYKVTSETKNGKFKSYTVATSNWS